MRDHDFLKCRADQQLLVVLLRHRERLVHRALRDQRHLQLTVTLHRPLVSAVINLHLLGDRGNVLFSVKLKHSQNR